MKFKSDFNKYCKSKIQSNGAIWWSNMELMQVAPLVANFATNSSSSTEINFKLFQLNDLLKLWTQYSGSVVPLVMFHFIFPIFICPIFIFPIFLFPIFIFPIFLFPIFIFPISYFRESLMRSSSCSYFIPVVCPLPKV